MAASMSERARGAVMRLRSSICAALLLFPLTACSPQSIMNWFAPHEQDAAARQIFDDIRKGDFAPVIARVPPEFRDQVTPASLQQLSDVWPKEEAKSVKLVGADTSSRSGVTLYSLTYEYEFSRLWIIANQALRKKGDETEIVGLHETPSPVSLEQQNAFTFEGKSLLQIVFLLLTAAIPVFTIVTAWFCWKTPIPRHKWLWVIFMLLGFSRLSLNWITGAWDFQPLNVTLFGALYSQDFYGPAVITAAFPAGAIVYWLRRRSWYAPPG